MAKNCKSSRDRGSFFWAEGTTIGIQFSKAAEICWIDYWKIVGYPKVWPQKSSWGFPVHFWPRVGLGRWRMRSLTSWRVYPLWSLKQNSDISSYAFLEHVGVLSTLSGNITEHLRHSFVTPEILCFTTNSYALKSGNILTLRENSKQTQSNHSGPSKKIVSAFIMPGTLIILYSVQYRLHHLHRNQQEDILKGRPKVINTL